MTVQRAVPAVTCPMLYIRALLFIGARKPYRDDRIHINQARNRSLFFVPSGRLPCSATHEFVVQLMIGCSTGRWISLSRTELCKLNMTPA